MAALQLAAPNTLKAIQAAMLQALPGRVDILKDAMVDRQGGEPAHGLGIVFNYPEFAILLDGAQIIVRSSVTLCIKPPVGSDPNRQMPFSKCWTRMILQSHPASTADQYAAIDLPDEILRAFDEDCTVLHRAAVDAILPDYAKVISAAMDQTLSLDAYGNGAFEVLTLGARGGDISEVFNAIADGETLTAQAADSDGARRLVDFALPSLTRQTGVTRDKALAAFRADDERQLLVVETGEADQALYLALFKNKTARFVGMAVDNGRRVPEALRNSPAEARHGVANVVSASLIANYARQF
ncbi:hypothetical protein [Phenylobacterium sp.]|uniref:hypothetical protein n=1 Tax=Phenylobacterium sp. TaxID=1871053 RepID=UPI0035636B6D